MRGLIFAGFCMITLLSFVGLSMLSGYYHWPIWVAAIVFVVAVIGFTYLMSLLVFKLQQTKHNKKEAPKDEQ
ncbi:conserved exported hypothetical protein [Weissella viridescens]|uniref:Uncharacterized protein n=3 Tax=Weissella viridescens TaxID=1629 RepID=A0A285PRP4_WEIVI|nr:hypothetical protein [Weissella viridescens]MBX4172654.1 hypothetical protein [Weissella viridescens]MCB6840429.1 hypothetical protein [Weissella viridescens]QOD86587.1 hypothetical protein IE337_03040 [Weissella viridescens]SOB44469.1 conserved exported hypothetical protein [Weissella viridescens]SUP61133.1 Uncharacterised protein [Weissella viridescens]